MKKEKFENEIQYIKNIEYIKNVETLLELVPDYFFDMPASTSGKYHPSYALGSGGLLRHTKAAIKIANELFNIENISGKYTSNEKDLIIIAIMFHDLLKKGETNEYHTRFDHPLIAAEFIEKNKGKTTFTEEEVNFISSCISTHMGQWNCDRFNSYDLPKPKNKFQNFVHMCDYLASRKFLEVPFDNNNNIIE